MHSLRKTESVEGIHNEGYAALAGLAVDADNRLVLASDIARIDRQVRNLPDAIGSLLKRLHTLADRILMGTGNAVNTSLPAYGCLGSTVIFVQRSQTSVISFTFPDSTPG